MALTILRAIAVHQKRVTALAFIDEDRVLCGSEDQTLSVWELAGDTRIHALTPPAEHAMHDANCVAVSPDRKRALSGHGSWGAVKLWDLESGAFVASLAGSAMYIGAVGFAPDGRLLAAKGPAAWVWSKDGDVEKEPPDDGGKSTPVALSPDGAHACRMTKKGVVLASFPSLKKKRELGTVPGNYAGTERGTVAFSPDGAHVAVGDAAGNVRVWRCADGAQVRCIDVPDEGDGVESIALTNGGHALVYGTQEGHVHCWIGDAHEKLKADHQSIQAVAIAPSGRRAALGMYKGDLRVLTIA